MNQKAKPQQKQKKMSRRVYDTSEVLELVAEDGSDDEPDIQFEHGYTSGEEDNEHSEDSDDDDDDRFQLFGDLETDETQHEDLDPSASDVDVDTEIDLADSPTQPPPDLSDFSDDDIIPPTPPSAQPQASSTPVPPTQGASTSMSDADTPDDQADIDEANLIFTDAGARDWVRDLTNYPIAPPFTGTSGFQIDIPADASPLFFYELFITDTVIKHFKSETNKYAARTCRAAKRRIPPPSKRSFFNKWSTVSEDDIRKFLAILIHMGLVQKPHINHYWTTNPVLASSFAPSVMKRDRFKMILAFFHLNDNTNFIPAGRPGHDPLFKVRPLFDSLNEKFKEIYIPDEYIAIDEAIVPWRGRVTFRVYIRNKPTKWGIKLYELCESTSGYLYNMEVYCKQPGHSNSSAAVVKRLLQPLENEGRTLFMDNYYMCPDLASQLLLEGTNSCGTTRANRKNIPVALKVSAQAFTAGQMDYRRKGGVLCVRWKDKRDILMLTTKHNPDMREVRTRTGAKQKPSCNADYTKYMKGVDHSDQMISYAPLHRKSVKWWKKLSFHLLSLVMVQAHCLYNKVQVSNRRKKMQFIPFVTAVCSALLEKAIRCPMPAAPPAQVNRFEGRHFMETIRGPTGRPLQRACHVCLTRMKRQGIPYSVRRNTRKLTRKQCKSCKVSLCEDCFETYHTEQNF